MRIVLIAILLFYRKYASPYLGGGCRFTPSCSQYALECIRRYGANAGLRLTVARLRRCKPTYPCGSDPVPDPYQINAAIKGHLLMPEKY